MKFIENIDKKRYEEFVKGHKKCHFLQSYAWGEIQEKNRKLIPHYVGVEKDSKLVATALLLEKKLPLGYSYFYSPRGFVINFLDNELLKFFTNEIKKYAKKKKSIFIKIDPDIIINKYNNEGKVIEHSKDYEKIFNNLKNLGFKHLGFTKNFESTQPRYSFRINLKNDIFDNFSKTTKQRINKAEKLHTKVRIGNIDDIKTFSDLMDITEKRKDFISYNYDYYKNFYEIYNKDNEMTFFVSSLNIKKVLKDYEDEKEKLQEEIGKIKNNPRKSGMLKEIISQEEKVNEYITEYKEALEKYGEEITLNIHVAVIYNDRAWGLYAANHNILMNSYSNYKTYYEHIKYCKEKGIKIFDQFGTIGDLNKDNPLLGIHMFKSGFGGEYIEFIGEFDLVLNKPMYLAFTKIIPTYRKIIKKRRKSKRD